MRPFHNSAHVLQQPLHIRHQVFVRALNRCERGCAQRRHLRAAAQAVQQHGRQGGEVSRSQACSTLAWQGAARALHATHTSPPPHTPATHTCCLHTAPTPHLHEHFCDHAKHAQAANHGLKLKVCRLGHVHLCSHVTRQAADGRGA